MKEFGTCDICGKEDFIERTYFYYPIKCNCCFKNHFKVVKHCKNCLPQIPKSIKIKYLDYDNKYHDLIINDIIPNKIDGNYKK